MSKFVRAASAAAALLLFASPAAADPFQSFLKACVTTNGDQGAAVAAVSALGWKPVPAEAIGDNDFPAEMENVAVHLNFDPNGDSLPETIELLMTGQADGMVVLDAPGVAMDLCGVLAPGGDAATLTEQATAYFGGPPQLTDGDYTAWIYSRQNGQIVSEADLADAEDDVILSAVRQRPLFAVFTVDEDGAAGLMLGAVRSTKGAAR